VQLKDAWEGRAVVVFVTDGEVLGLEVLSGFVLGLFIVDMRYVFLQVLDVVLVVEVGHLCGCGPMWLINVHFLMEPVS